MVTTAAMSEMQDIITLVVGHCVRVSWTAASPKWSTSSCEDIVKKREKKTRSREDKLEFNTLSWFPLIPIQYHTKI